MQVSFVYLQLLQSLCNCRCFCLLMFCEISSFPKLQILHECKLNVFFNDMIFRNVLIIFCDIYYVAKRKRTAKISQTSECSDCFRISTVTAGILSFNHILQKLETMGHSSRVYLLKKSRICLVLNLITNLRNLQEKIEVFMKTVHQLELNFKLSRQMKTHCS